VPCEGLPLATPFASIETQLESAAEFGRQSGWQHVDDLLRLVRLHIGDDIPREHHDGFVHWDTNPSNILIDDATVRFVDWEYGGVGDPSGDIANLCTSPSVVDMPNDLAKRLLEEHAEALGDSGLVDRTNAWILTMLTYWCCRSGASLQNGITERDIDPQRSAVARIEHYSERLAELLGLRRTEIDHALSP
jgi:thiamine kinase-like enzyme